MQRHYGATNMCDRCTACYPRRGTHTDSNGNDRIDTFGTGLKLLSDCSSIGFGKRVAPIPIDFHKNKTAQRGCTKFRLRQSHSHPPPQKRRCGPMSIAIPISLGPHSMSGLQLNVFPIAPLHGIQFNVALPLYHSRYRSGHELRRLVGVRGLEVHAVGPCAIHGEHASCAAEPMAASARLFNRDTAR